MAATGGYYDCGSVGALLGGKEDVDRWIVGDGKVAGEVGVLPVYGWLGNLEGGNAL
jgi:hypothetical protein